jgi:hypothetical protein
VLKFGFRDPFLGRDPLSGRDPPFENLRIRGKFLKGYLKKETNSRNIIELLVTISLMQKSRFFSYKSSIYSEKDKLNIFRVKQPLICNKSSFPFHICYANLKINYLNV